MLISGKQIYITSLSLDHTVHLLQSKERFHTLYDIPNEPNWPSDAIKIMLPLHYERLVNNNLTYTYGPCMIQQKDSNRIIGEFNFKKTDGTTEIGYRIYPQYRNKGFATEAVRYVCEWLVNNKEIDKVTAMCGRLNKVSQQILRKNGFQIKLVTGDIIKFEKNVKSIRCEQYNLF
ncbi:hypothetical protein GCM10011351_02810 [Paraliobacillus quinghaiensis]|uniref:N-acetyltransferase domain-containing protein n=1 Tax=Paraliobacillus quinghaiensis TaxID=470815 RepID=A0A917TF20_9BACI|nr:GNAT family N-acetyltransferase [Paraliobacillus quinghaiensis]GGM20403.1 hypothetical protein GCM10011351_02810 [Paraliobacillus quinghaiensis]